jgi:steroid 5-alpha reductase family enzyme
MVLELLLLSLVFSALLFTAAYCVARHWDNYGIVDFIWAYCFTAVAVLAASFGEGWGWRRALVATLVCGWSLRLGTHLARRVLSHHPQEDTRYRELRTRWSAHFGRSMFLFFQGQALSVVFLALPLFLAAANPHTGLRPVEWVGLVLWLVAWSGESLADAQLAAFKRNPANRGGVCQHGLWRYSRHPNYFFEWLNWVALALVAVGSPWGWLGLLSPVVILHLLLNVTGIPLTEEQSLKARGAAYRRYQETTSAFFPWFPRSSPSLHHD